jgi:cytidylate kinase
MTDKAGSAPVVIAVDGTAASGKGTLARRLAKHFGYAYLDTGLLYRATARAVLDTGRDGGETEAARAASAIQPEDLDNPTLRDEDVGRVASIVAAMPRVREALVKRQRDFAVKPPGGAPGVVLDGRDIGTVICPDANIKIYIDAALEIRAARRVKELQESGVEAIHARVLHEMRERDLRDRTRNVAPLAVAKDAIRLDTSDLDADAAFARTIDLMQRGTRPR